VAGERDVLVGPENHALMWVGRVFTVYVEQSPHNHSRGNG
jgi:hypothetical protein